MLFVTTSWDDGDVLDLRLADLLDAHGIKGTFYITKTYRPVRLSEREIKALSARHEIGAHTLTHIDMSKAPESVQREELAGSKSWLESATGREVPMFCYPSGRLGADSKRLVREAGFKGARTTELGSIARVADPFMMSTTIQAYPFPFRKKDAHSMYWRKLVQPIRERGPALRKLGVPLAAFHSWEALAQATFDIALERGGVYHIWGHSWEIDRYGMWDALGSVLRYMSGRADCQYLTNGDIISGL